MKPVKSMKSLEEIMHGGAVGALKNRIHRLKELISDDNWHNTARNGQYSGLGEAITNGEELLQEMRETLAVLMEMDPGNN